MMKGRVKKFFALSLCLCMMIGGKAYAEEGNQEGSDIVAASEQKTMANKGTEGVAINEANFPDEKFREVVKEYDTNGKPYE